MHETHAGGLGASLRHDVDIGFDYYAAVDGLLGST